MKRLALLATTVLFAGATHAAEIRNVITDSVQLTVNPTVTVTTPTSATYSVSGTNVDVTTLGKVGTAGSYDIFTNGQAFSFSETTAVAGTSTQVHTAGTAGTLAGALSPTGVATITAGGPGSEGVIQRSIELSVFQ
jgi:hypothetical protein